MVRVKSRCEKCKKVYNKCKLRRHHITGELWCRICINKYGENKFNFNKDIPFKTLDKIGKFKMTMDEKKLLVKNLNATGVSMEDAWRKVNRNSLLLSKMKKKYFIDKKLEIKLNKYKENKMNELNKQFLQGLGQK